MRIPRFNSQCFSTQPWILLVAWGLLQSTVVAQAPTAEQLDFFENKIRPVLVEHCYPCHSAAAADNGAVRGGLRLDSRADLLRGGDSGPAIVPGKASESLLLSALRYESYEMPPDGQLPAAVVTDFADWIDQGAADPRHSAPTAAARVIDIAAGRKFWAFRPLEVSPALAARPPHVHPIDFFITAAQRGAGLEMSPPAAARQLLRRAWFDLLGLPPTPEEIEYWLPRLTAQGASPGDVEATAWGELIDALLARPEYGERWARHWMDVARFGESFGYEQDYDRPHAYHYRDFLIRAFNADLPFDQFVQWQIAGDRLQPDNPQAWMATGFLAAGAFPTQLTEAEFESARYDELDDIVATTGVAFLGLSLGCARCHDHKFDPLTMDDYYRFAATFTQTIRSEQSFLLAPAEAAAREAAWTADLARLQEELARYRREVLPQEFRDWLASQPGEVTAEPLWRICSAAPAGDQGTAFQRLEDDSWLALGTPPDRENFTCEWSPPAETQVAAIRLEALADSRLPHGGPGRAGNGNFALGFVQVDLVEENGNRQPLHLAAARATFQQNDTSLSVAAALDADPSSGWAVDGQIGKDHAAVFQLAQPLSVRPGQRLRVRLEFQHPNPRHAVGRLRLATAADPAAAALVGNAGPSAEVAAALRDLARQTPQEWADAADQSTAAWQTGITWFESRSPRYRELAQQLAARQAAGSGVSPTPVLVASEGLPHLPHHADDRGYPHFYPETHLLRRGDVHQKVAVVAPGFPQVLQPVSTAAAPTAPADAAAAGSPRVALATWLTDVERGPGALVARVAVNRLWQHHFGRGLVATPNDFGEMGERPTHPELLEWLAAELIAGNWRLKPLQRTIMTSRTYRQGGLQAADPRYKLDPDNRLWWHRSPRRLEAEAIRDAMLAVAGQLDRTMYGPGSLDPLMKRRSIYFFIKRSQLIPSMMLFDWPEHLVSIGQRSSTTIAPQALLFLNNQPARDAAAALARRILVAGPAERAIAAAYRLALAREPTADELTAGRDFVQTATAARAATGDAEPELTAWTDYCQLLLGTNEFIYID